VLYRRHDDVPDANVVRSLWDEICKATHVLVDLTSMNANVTLELGLAHALGKACCIVGQRGFNAALFESLKRMRFVEYELGNRELEDAVQAFVNQ
jgi:hypothetical protein